MDYFRPGGRGSKDEISKMAVALQVASTLETTLRKMAPPKSGLPLECCLNQIAFPES